MTTIDMLTQRNHEFAAQRFTPGLPLMPTLGTMIISCADPRVDPAHVLGLEPGEAVILRNIGGRITPATLQMMGMLRTVAQVEGLAPAPYLAASYRLRNHTSDSESRYAGWLLWGRQ